MDIMTEGKKKILVRILIVILIIYVGGVIIFSFVTYPKTYVNGNDRGIVSKQETFEGQILNDIVIFNGRDNDQVKISPGSIGFSKSIVEYPDLNQNAFLWPIKIFKTFNYDVDYRTSFNDEKLDEYIKKSTFLSKRKESEDAYLDFDSLEIVGEVYGNEYLMNDLKKIIIESFKNDVTGVVDVSEIYINPEVTRDDESLVSELEKLKKIYETKITYDFGDRKETLTGKELFSLFDKINGEYVLNKESSREYIKNLAIKYDTYNRKRQFNATGIGEITVREGIYGWLMNVDKTNDELEELVDKAGEVEVEPVYIYEALSRDENDIGDSYIEVDISRQEIWLYKDGELLHQAYVRTGKLTSKGYSTTVGVGKIWSKETDRYLQGLNPGMGTTYSSHVNYWMPIGYTGIGLHDASWVDKFGGDIYKTKGSRGCINLDLETAKMIYDNYSNGTPVVVYESSTNDSPTEFERQKEANNN